MGINIPRLTRAKMMNTQNPTALIRYGVISLTKPPAREKAIVANATPFARLARGKISVGYTQLKNTKTIRILNKYQRTWVELTKPSASWLHK